MKAHSDGAGRPKPSEAARRANPTGRSSQLTRDDITSAALEAADRGELELLTMRGLAEELGVTAMALYTHVENKDDILDQIIDRVLAREALARPDETEDWKAWTIATAERLRSVLTRYPALLDRYCRRPVGVPAALSRMEAAFEVLRSAGFDAQGSIAAYTTIHTYTLGFAALEIVRDRFRGQQPTRSDGAITESSPHYWPAFFAGLPDDEYPNLTRMTPDLAEFTTDEQFRRGLLTVLHGLDAERFRRAAEGSATDVQPEGDGGMAEDAS